MPVDSVTRNTRTPGRAHSRGPGRDLRGQVDECATELNLDKDYEEVWMIEVKDLGETFEDV